MALERGGGLMPTPPRAWTDLAVPEGLVFSLGVGRHHVVMLSRRQIYPGGFVFMPVVMIHDRVNKIG